MIDVQAFINAAGGDFIANNVSVVNASGSPTTGYTVTSYNGSVAQTTGKSPDTQVTDFVVNYVQTTTNYAFINPNSLLAPNPADIISYQLDFADGTLVPPIYGEVVGYNGDQLLVEQFNNYVTSPLNGKNVGILDPNHFELFSLTSLDSPGVSAPLSFVGVPEPSMGLVLGFVMLGFVATRHFRRS